MDLIRIPVHDDEWSWVDEHIPAEAYSVEASDISINWSTIVIHPGVWTTWYLMRQDLLDWQ